MNAKHHTLIAVSLIIGIGICLKRNSSPPSSEAAAITKSISAVTKPNVPTFSEQQAINLALNELIPTTQDALRLENPHHTVDYSSSEGVTFAPRFSDLSWNWQLSHFGSAERNWLRDPETRPEPIGDKSSAVSFHYGAFTELYLAKQHTVEQRFVLREHPAALQDGKDLVIRGAIDCAGEFDSDQSERGWIWRGTDKVVSLGQVTVFDADGQILPATMTADSDSTEITVDGAALLAANYPVTVDPEIGTNDFTISALTGSGPANRHELPAITHNPDDNQFCVVWLRGSNSDWEVLAQLVDSATGELIGEPILVGAFADPSQPAVDYDGTGYLIAWSDTTPRGRYLDTGGNLLGSQALALGQDEHSNLSLCANRTSGGFLFCSGNGSGDFSTRIIAANGELGPVSTVADSRADSIDSAYNSDRNEFCVSWVQSEEIGTLRRVVAGRFDSAGNQIPGVALVSQSGGGTSGSRIAFNSASHEYCIVWTQEGTNEEESTEIHGRLYSPTLTANTSEFRISEEFTSGFGLAFRPDVVASPDGLSYFVTWLRAFSESDGVRAAVVRVNTGQVMETEFVLSAEPSDACVIANAPIMPGADRLFAVHTAKNVDKRTSGQPAERLLLGTSLENVNSSLAVTSARPVGFDLVPPELSRSAPSVAYSPQREEYMVVWEQEYSQVGDWQIMSRTIGSNGRPSDVYVVSRDPDSPDATLTNNHNPNVCAGPGGRFLIAWQGDKLESDGALTIRKTDIFGRGWYGPDDNFGGDPFQISVTGYLFNDAITPDIAFNEFNNQFLVVWSATGDLFATANENPEIYARRVGGNTFDLFPNIAKLSNSAPGDVPAVTPAVAYNSLNHDFVVVWEGFRDFKSRMATGESEIIGRRVSSGGSATGAETQVSYMGPEKDPQFKAIQPDIAFNPNRNNYLVVWAGQQFFVKDTEIHGQILDADGTKEGSEVQISDMGQGGSFANFWIPSSPAVAYEGTGDRYLVFWSSEHVAPLTFGEREIFAREIVVTADIFDGLEQERISDVGPDRRGTFDAERPVVAGDGSGNYLIVFDGNDDQIEQNPDRTAIIGQEFQTSRTQGVRDLRFENSGGDFRVIWMASVGTRVFVEVSSDLKNWQDLSGEIVCDEGINVYQDDRAFFDYEQRYYRLVLVE